MKKIPKQEYTAEFKEQAVKRAQEVGTPAAARELGVVEQTLRNWAKAAAAGKLNAVVIVFSFKDFGCWVAPQPYPEPRWPPPFRDDL